VRSHHERYDGRGVPDGLKNTEIPLEARIAAAADSLDAMTSDRPYRPTEMTLEMAMDELRRCSGTQFDPDVVAATVAAADRGDLLLVPKTGTFQVPARV
jgi:HD-GYP domain-containing protein (c-di-GMP phosphodiesterase class II)